jgi:hypothetical protein
MQGVIDSAVADLVDWLAGEPDCTAVIRDIATSFADDVLDRVNSLLDAERTTTAKIASHFWCELVAALAGQVAEILELLKDGVIRTVQDLASLVETSILRVLATALHTPPSRGTPAGTRRATKAVYEIALRVLATKIAELILAKPQLVLRALRILGVFICPAPEYHPAVLEYCLEPLLKEILVDKATGVLQAETIRRLRLVRAEASLAAPRYFAALKSLEQP